MPLLNPDELRYTLAARGLVDGEWVNLRGEPYGYGPVYPLVLAPIVALSDGVESAYPFFKLANALLFALAAVPVYLVARRLLSAWWSVGVAAASIVIPSSIYTSLVLTESAAYLAASLALLAVILALERPSPGRQLAMLGAVGLAYATRPQFASLLPAFLVGALVVWVVDAERPTLPSAAVRLWPTLASVAAIAVYASARLLLTSSPPEGSFGGYADLWREYDPLPVARFAVYHLAAWEIYLFVDPVPGRSDRRRRAPARCAARRGARGRVRRRVPHGERRDGADRRGLRQHALRILGAPRPVPLLRRAAVARRVRRLARARPAAAAAVDRDVRRARARCFRRSFRSG